MLSFLYINDKKQRDHLIHFVSNITSENGINFSFRFDEGNKHKACHALNANLTIVEHMLIYAYSTIITNG